jgi:hypothetical protein
MPVILATHHGKFFLKERDTGKRVTRDLSSKKKAMKALEARNLAHARKQGASPETETDS